jgi:hypothetical protein
MMRNLSRYCATLVFLILLLGVPIDPPKRRILLHSFGRNLNGPIHVPTLPRCLGGALGWVSDATA